MSFVCQELQIASWNGRGIRRTHEYFDMGSAIRKLAINRHTLCFQEVHGHAAAVRASFKRWLPGWSIVPPFVLTIKVSLTLLLGGSLLLFA